MFAVVEFGGKQYLVKEKDILRVELMEVKEGDTGSSDKVLFASTGAADAKIGAPFLPGASVEFKVRANGKGDKVRTFKIKAKKRYKRLKGHRQHYTEIEVTKIKA